MIQVAFKTNLNDVLIKLSKKWDANLKKKAESLADEGLIYWRKLASSIPNQKLRMDYTETLQKRMGAAGRSRVGMFAGVPIYSTSLRGYGESLMESIVMRGAVSGPFYPRAWEVGIESMVTAQQVFGKKQGWVPVGKSSNNKPYFAKLPGARHPRWTSKSAPGYKFREKTLKHISEIALQRFSDNLLV